MIKLICSHPGRSLTDHLVSVERRMLQSFDDMKIDTYDTWKISNETFKILIRSVALSHDIGKATKLFQKRLKDHKTKVFHSPVSSVYSYILAKESLKGKVTSEVQKVLSFFAFTVVRRHHGFLVQSIDEVSDMQYRKNALIKTTGFIDKGFVEWFKSETGVIISKESTKNAIEEMENIDEDVEAFVGKKSDFSSYFLLNILYSLLVDADRIDAATRGKNNVTRIRLNGDIVEKYTRANFRKPLRPIEKLRTLSHKETLNNRMLNPKNHIYTLTLPTGGGKTLTSLSAALKLRKKIERGCGRSPRIIYTLPFTSLIDQNANVISKVLKFSFGNVTSDLFLVQHHLAPISYTTKGNKPFSSDLSSLFISSWNSEIVATTFVSLFDGIISNKRSNLRKLHNIVGSIIILDEVQNIPHEYWMLMKNIFEFMAQKLGTYFIFTTATQPNIFANAVELSKNSLKWFKRMKRTKIISEIDNINDYSKLYRKVLEKLRNGKRVLTVFNTINTAQTFFKMFKGVDIKKGFLSSGVIPIQRKRIVEKIKKSPNEVKLLVSTQVVEAGMEFDFDVVYRDIAPMDSIIQSSGRCNRNYRKEAGEIYVFDLKNENGISYSKYVYDSALIEISREILRTRRETQEKDFIPSLITPYFKKMLERTSDVTSQEYISLIENLIYTASTHERLSISKLSIINSNLFRMPVYVQQDKTAKELWNEFEDMEELDPKEWYKKSKILFKKMRKYMIMVNVTKEFLENAPPLFNPLYGKSLYLIERENVDSFYDDEIGFFIKDNGGMII